MSLVSVICFFCILFFLYFGINLYKQNRHSEVNILFFILCIVNCMAAFFSMLQYSAENLEKVQLWNKFYMPLSFLTVGLILHLHIAIWKKKKLNLLIYFLTYLPSLYFIIYVLSGHYFLGEYIEGPYGWYPAGVQSSFLTTINTIIFSLFSIIEIVLILLYGKRVRLKRKKRQARLLLISLLLSFAFSGITTNLTLSQKLPLPLLPFLGHVIWFGGVWIALSRYGFLKIDLELVSPEVVSKIKDYLIICSNECSIIDFNNPFAETFGYNKNTERPSLETFLTDETVQIIKQMLISRDTSSKSIDTAFKTRSAEYIPVHLQISPVINTLDEIEGITLLSWDLRPIRALEQLNEKSNALAEERRLLLQEVPHRIKNTINTIRSLLHIQAMKSDNETVQTSFSDAVNRIISMAHLYDKIYVSENISNYLISDYLRTLIGEIIATFPAHKEVDLELDIDDFNLKPQNQFQFGIIINEIVTNTMKYAGVPGTRLKFTVKASCDSDKITILLSDNGPGFPPDFSFDGNSGFGTSLIKNLVVQLNGSVDIINENGAAYKIILPN